LLLPAARVVRVVPDVQRCNLLSLGQLCDAGYEIRVDQEWLTVWNDHHCVLKGARCPTNGMWQLNVDDCPKEQYQHHNSPYDHESMNALAKDPSPT
jgi:hypothetical protein